MFLMQAEVAERLTAVPGTRDFGYLTVETQLYSRPENLFPVGRAAFHPPPKVDSAVVRLEPRDAVHADFGISDPAAFLRFASACFRHKRKTLRNNLAGLYGADRVGALVEGRLACRAVGRSRAGLRYARSLTDSLHTFSRTGSNCLRSAVPGFANMTETCGRGTTPRVS